MITTISEFTFLTDSVNSIFTFCEMSIPEGYIKYDAATHGKLYFLASSVGPNFTMTDDDYINFDPDSYLGYHVHAKTTLNANTEYVLFTGLYTSPEYTKNLSSRKIHIKTDGTVTIEHTSTKTAEEFYNGGGYGSTGTSRPWTPTGDFYFLPSAVSFTDPRQPAPSSSEDLTTGGSQLPQVTGFKESKASVSDTTSFFLQKLTSFFANNVYLHDDLKTDLSTRLRALETSITEANTQVTQALQQSNPRREVPITDEKPTLPGFTYEFQGVMGTSSEITDTSNKWSVVFSFNMGVIDVMLRIQDECEISVSTGIEILSQLTTDEKALIMSVIGSTSYRGVVATRFTSEIPQENYSVDYDSTNSTITFKGTDISGASETDIFQPGDYNLRFFTDYDGVTDVDQIEETSHFSKLYLIYTIKASESSDEPEAEP